MKRAFIFLTLAACGYDDSKNKCVSTRDCLGELVCNPQGVCDTMMQTEQTETSAERPFNGTWKLVANITASSSIVGSSTNIQLKSHHTVEAVETETTVTFTTPYCSLLATKSKDGLTMRENQTCIVPVGTLLTLELGMGPDMWGPLMSLNSGLCYNLSLDRADTTVGASATAITFTSGTGRAGSGDGLGCTVPDGGSMGMSVRLDFTR
jgi:hypothetical protein